MGSVACSVQEAIRPHDGKAFPAQVAPHAVHVIELRLWAPDAERAARKFGRGGKAVDICSANFGILAAYFWGLNDEGRLFGVDVLAGARR